MINSKVEIFYNPNYKRLENSINDFLRTIDVRQVVKIDFSTSGVQFSAMVFYIKFEDIRDIKIDNILNVK